MYAKSEHVQPGYRATLVDEVMDLPEVKTSDRVEATVPLGDVESVERLRQRTDNAVLRAAGGTTLLDANLPPDGGHQAGPDACAGTSPPTPATSPKKVQGGTPKQRRERRPRVGSGGGSRSSAA